MKVLNSYRRHSFSNVILIFFVLPLPFLSSCNSKSAKDKNNPIVIVDDIEIVKFDELFEETGKTVQLESGEDIMLGGRLNFNFFEENIYVLDRDRSRLLRFYKDGSFLNTIGKKGKGPAEYLRIGNFYVDKHGVTIVFTTGTTTNIYDYTHNGAFINSRKLENFSVMDIEKQNNQYQIYTSHNRFVHQYRIYQLESNFNIAGQFLENDFTGNPFATIEHNFVRLKDRLFLRESTQPIIYEITKDSVAPAYQFDYGKYSIPEEYWSKEGIEGFELILNNGVAFTRYFLQGDRYALIVVLFQKNGEESRINYIVHDKISGKYRKAILQESDNTYVFREPIGVGDNNEFLFMGFDQFEPLASAELKDGMEMKNPVIKYFKIAQ